MLASPKLPGPPRTFGEPRLANALLARILLYI
jgi:hypothetical protein